MGKPVIRPLKRQDIIEIYGDTLWASVRGVAAELDGRVIGVAGIASSHPPQCFSVITDELKKYPRQIVEAVRIIRDMLNNSELPVYATPDEGEDTAVNFLTHVGFKPINEGVYQWQQHSQ